MLTIRQRSTSNISNIVHVFFERWWFIEQLVFLWKKRILCRQITKGLD